MSVTHKLTIKMTETSQNAKESDLLFPLPVVSFDLLKKISLTDRIRDTDNLRTIALPGVIYGTPIQYLVVIAKYTVTNSLIGAVAGMPAPFSVRLNGDAASKAIGSGVLVWGGEVTALQIETAVTDYIEYEILAGI
jgi:hypothetical protein